MKRPHYKLILAWAEGAEIEQRFSKKWITADKPQWYEEYEYRVKPIEATLAQPVIVPTQFQVLAITTAYERGVGKGQQGVNFNPYKTGYCADAWAMGFDQGQNHALPSGVSRG